MKYVLYFLEFDTPVHFGCGEDGGKLEQSALIYRADTLFGALCYELASAGNQSGLEKLYILASNGQLLLSDLFPYSWQEEPELYLPKPILPLTREKTVVHEDYDSFKKQTTQRKRLKKLQYLRVSELQPFIQALQTEKTPKTEILTLGQGQTLTRVNCLEEIPRPYYVHAITLAERTGLYGILSFQDDADADWLLGLIEQLGLSGIGGKRSSGYGKYHFQEDPLFLDATGIYTDDGLLYRLLTARKAQQYMNLSVLLPRPDEVSQVKKGKYTLCKRSGFLSPEGGQACKKQDVYMIQAGSCFPQPLQGSITDVSTNNRHPVWRYGKGLYVGLTL